MGILAHGKTLWRALFTRTQRRVLGLLYGFPERSFYANEIVRLAAVGTGSVQRELARLAGAGIVTVTRVGNQKHYRADPHCPIFAELRGIVVKTLGALDVLRHELSQLPSSPQQAFLFAPVPGEPDTALGLFIVSDTPRREGVAERMRAAGERIGRRIHPVVMSPAEFRARRRRGDASVTEPVAALVVLLAGQMDEK